MVRFALDKPATEVSIVFKALLHAVLFTFSQCHLRDVTRREALLNEENQLANVWATGFPCFCGLRIIAYTR